MLITNNTKLEVFEPVNDSSSFPIKLGHSQEETLKYPHEALGVVLGNAALLIQKQTKAPLALCGQSILMSAALPAQALRNVSIDSRQIPLALYALTIAESGERKSSVDKLSSRPIESWEEEQNEQYLFEKEKYLQKYKALELAEKSIKKRLRSEVDPNLIEKELNALAAYPKPPLMPMVRIDDPTIEGLQKHFRNAYPYIGIYSDEGAVFLGGHSMKAEKAARTIGLLSNMWSGSKIDMMRADEDVGTFSLKDRRVSIHLMIQPVIAKEVLGNPLLVQQGFIPRFLLSEPQSTMGIRYYEAFEIDTKEEYQLYCSRIKSILNLTIHNIKKDGSLELPLLGIDDIAKKRWIEFHDEIEEQLGKGSALHSISGAASKIAEQALRIAGVLTVVNSNNESDFISIKEMESGITLAKYSLSQLIKITDKSSKNEVIEDAKALLNWIAKKRIKYIYSSLDPNKRPSRVREKGKYLLAIKVLEDYGYVVSVGDIDIDGGIRKDVHKIIHYHEPK